MKFLIKRVLACSTLPVRAGLPNSIPSQHMDMPGKLGFCRVGREIKWDTQVLFDSLRRIEIEPK